MVLVSNLCRAKVSPIVVINSSTTIGRFPPFRCFRLKFKRLNLRVFCIASQVCFRHLPPRSSFSSREKGKQSFHREEESSDHHSCVYNNCKVGNASKSFAGGRSLIEIVIWDTDVFFFFCTFISASAFYGDTHYFVSMWVPSNNVNAGMVNRCTLKAILREPVKHESFTEITGNLGVSRTLSDLHISL